MKNLERIRKDLTPARRRKIESHAAQLIAEEMSLPDLRQALKLTQASMAETLGIGQEGVSRLEKRTDLLIATLRSHVEAMGGSWSIVAKFPDRPPMLLSGLATVELEPTHTSR